MDPIVLAALVVGVVGTAAALVWRGAVDRRRREQMRSFGRIAGLRDDPSGEGSARAALARQPLTRHGRDATFLSLLRGSWDGGDLLLFDYRQRVGTMLTALTADSLVADAALGVRRNRAPTFYNMTVAAFRAGARRPPVFETRNGRLISGTLQEQVRELLRGLPGHLHAECDGEWIVVYRFDRRVPAAQLADFLRRARRFAEAAAGGARSTSRAA